MTATTPCRVNFSNVSSVSAFENWMIFFIEAKYRVRGEKKIGNVLKNPEKQIQSHG